MPPQTKTIDDIINASSISEFLSEVKSDNTNVDASKGGIQDPNIEASLLNFIKDAGYDPSSAWSEALNVISEKYGSPHVRKMEFEDFEKSGKLFKNKIPRPSNVEDNDILYEVDKSTDRNIAKIKMDNSTGEWYRYTPRASFSAMSLESAIKEYNKSGKYAYELKDKKGYKGKTIIKDNPIDLSELDSISREKIEGVDWQDFFQKKKNKENREVVPDNFVFTDTLNIPRGDLHRYFAELAHEAQMKGLNYKKRKEYRERVGKEKRKYGEKTYEVPGTLEYIAHEGGKDGGGLERALKEEYFDLVKALTKTIQVDSLFDN
jgi:hypothetical protein|tara:strand:+ start:57 stop:1013 length:957 start_codon:yes stop_codon:yes gene_type:complete